MPCFPHARALLNYMKPGIEKNGTLDADARKYWMQLRERAGVSTDIDATIAATDLSKRIPGCIQGLPWWM